MNSVVENIGNWRGIETGRTYNFGCYIGTLGAKLGVYDGESWKYTKPCSDDGCWEWLEQSFVVKDKKLAKLAIVGKDVKHSAPILVLEK